MSNDLLVVDNSTLKAVACSTKALMRYHLGWTTPEERAALKAGLAAHAALAAYLDPQSVNQGDVEWAMAIFADQYKTFAETTVAEGNRLSWWNVSRIMRRWFEEHKLDSLPFTVEHVEVGFQFPLTDDIAACGRMDGVVRVHVDAKRYVLETKTTGNVTPWWLEDFNLDSQISHYVEGATKHLGGDAVNGAILNVIEFKKIPESQGRCREHGRPYAECGVLHPKFDMPFVQRTPELLAEWRKTAISLAKRWRDLKQRFPLLSDIPRVRTQGMFIRGMCAGCEFKNFCLAGRPLELVDSMFVKDPWNPLAHAVAGRETPSSPAAPGH